MCELQTKIIMNAKEGLGEGQAREDLYEMDNQIYLMIVMWSESMCKLLEARGV